MGERREAGKGLFVVPIRMTIIPIFAVVATILGAFLVTRLEMKQLLFMVGMLTIGSLGSLYHPFWGILLYYSFAVLRPQYLWAWSLPEGMRWSMFAAVVVLISCVLNFGKLMERRRLNIVLVLMLVYGMWLMLSVLMAHDPQLAISWGVEYAKILLLGVIASFVIRHLWQVRIISLMILITLGYIAWEINYLYLFDARLDIFHRGFGGLDNNGAGLMLAMGVPFAYAFAVCARERWKRAVSWGVCLLMVHAVLMSYSRGAMLSLALAAIWLIIHHRPRHHAMVIAIAATLAVSVLAGKEIRERFNTTMNYQDDRSATSRFDSWAAGWRIAMENPLAGQGIRNSNLYTQNYGADRRGRTIHSQYIQIAADSGIPAMLTSACILGVSFYNIRNSRGRCLDYLDRGEFDEVHLREPDPLIYQSAYVALACETSLFIFAFGGMFLSLEVFELPWLLIVIAGIMPGAVQHHIEKVKASELLHSPARRRGRKRRRRKTEDSIGMPGIEEGLAHS